MNYEPGDCRVDDSKLDPHHHGRMAYLGKTFTKADNPKLPYPVKILPSGAAYGETGQGSRRLGTMAHIFGISVSLLDDTEVLFHRNGKVYVGEEIRTLKKEEEVDAKAS